MTHGIVCRCRRAFTLVEATISCVIVAVMLVAALNTVSSARLGEHRLATRCRGLSLAQEVMAEILQQAYEDPNASAVFGVESGEQTTVRVDFDDVDDYHNWSSSPPQQPDGTVLPGLDGWERLVQLEWLEPTNLSQTALSDKGVKKIVVTMKFQNVPVISLVAFRSRAWPEFY